MKKHGHLGTHHWEHKAGECHVAEQKRAQGIKDDHSFFNNLSNKKQGHEFQQTKTASQAADCFLCHTKTDSKGRKCEFCDALYCKKCKHVQMKHVSTDHESHTWAHPGYTDCREAMVENDWMMAKPASERAAALRREHGWRRCFTCNAKDTTGHSRQCRHCKAWYCNGHKHGEMIKVGHLGRLGLDHYEHKPGRCKIAEQKRTKAIKDFKDFFNDAPSARVVPLAAAIAAEAVPELIRPSEAASESSEAKEPTTAGSDDEALVMPATAGIKATRAESALQSPAPVASSLSVRSEQSKESAPSKSDDEAPALLCGDNLRNGGMGARSTGSLVEVQPSHDAQDQAASAHVDMDAALVTKTVSHLDEKTNVCLADRMDTTSQASFAEADKQQDLALDGAGAETEGSSLIDSDTATSSTEAAISSKVKNLDGDDDDDTESPSACCVVL